MFARWALIPQETDGTFRQTVTDVFADDHVCVALTEVTGTRRGRTLSSRNALVYVIRDGKMTEGRVIAADPEANDAFWAE